MVTHTDRRKIVFSLVNAERRRNGISPGPPNVCTASYEKTGADAIGISQSLLFSFSRWRDIFLAMGRDVQAGHCRSWSHQLSWHALDLMHQTLLSTPIHRSRTSLQASIPAWSPHKHLATAPVPLTEASGSGLLAYSVPLHWKALSTVTCRQFAACSHVESADLSLFNGDVVALARQL